MSNAAFLPPVRQPPHDPLAFRLDARTGWRPLRPAQPGTLVAADGRLGLAPVPGTGRLLSEASGSLGGIVPPIGSAFHAGELYLLHPKSGHLLRFDPCCCRFDVVPGFPGFSATRDAAGARHLVGGGGLTIGGGNLLVADPDRPAVSVFALHGLVLRGHWRPPEHALDNPFRPVDVVLDRACRAWVADPNNGAVHVFDRVGGYLRSLTGLGAIASIALDCEDRLYVHAGPDGHPDTTVAVYDASGALIERVVRPEQVLDRFPVLPIRVDAAGRLGLDRLCDPRSGPHVFDRFGRPVHPAPPLERDYPTTATWWSAPLDSRLHGCQWHRIELDAQLPRRTRLRVRTFTAAVALPPEMIEALSDDRWETNQTAEGVDGRWECLIRSEPGRFLWLRLDLEGTGHDTPTIRMVRIEFPRIGLSRHLPAAFVAEPTSGDFTDRLLAIFDSGFRTVERTVDTQARLFDPRSAPDGSGVEGDFLSWLASWIGVTANRQWPVKRRRRYLREVGRLFTMRGTRKGLRAQLLLFLGVSLRDPCERPPLCAPCGMPAPPSWEPPTLILEHFQTRRWLHVGAARLGDQARLWGARIVGRTQLDGNAQMGATRLDSTPDPMRDSFLVHAHRFTVFLPAALARAPQERRAVEQLVEHERPGHTAWDIQWVEPRFRIGVQSMIGYDAVIGTYPTGGVRLSSQPLGRATVLGAPTPKTPTPVVGKEARLGTTTID